MKPLKRIDFAAPQPSLNKLPSVHEGYSHDPDSQANDGDDDRSTSSESSDSSNDVDGNDDEPANVSGSNSTGNGLGKLVAHAANGGGGPGGVPNASSKNGVSASTTTGAAFGRWL